VFLLFTDCLVHLIQLLAFGLSWRLLAFFGFLYSDRFLSVVKIFRQSLVRFVKNKLYAKEFQVETKKPHFSFIAHIGTV